MSEITPSKNRATLDKIQDAISRGKSIANTTEVLMDRNFIEKYRHDWCWLNWKNTPTKIGWYKIDRINKRFIKISDKKASKLVWHERLFIYQSALTAVKKKNT